MCVLSLLFCGWGLAQAPLLYEHEYPVLHEEHPRIRRLIDEISEERLTSTIEHLCAYHTRRWDSRMVYEVQDWLYETYYDMGFDTVVLHDFQFVSNGSVYETSDNVIAIQRGTVYPDEYVVCGAHYDCYNLDEGHPDSLRAPGADDNASGMAGILETARLLSQCKFERSILYCGWAAEEVGLKGSAAFANDCAANKLDIVGYFNLDMTGYLEEGAEMKVYLLYTSRDSLLANYVYNFSAVYFPEMPIRQGWLSWGDSDYSSFNRAGYAAVHPFENPHHSSPFIHSTSDILGVSVNNMAQCKRFAELNLGLVATLAGLVETSVPEDPSDVLAVYPNPVRDHIIVRGVPMRQIEVFDTLGRRVLKETCHDEEVRLDVSSLVAGVYVLRVVDDAMNVHSHRFVTY